MSAAQGTSEPEQENPMEMRTMLVIAVMLSGCGPRDTDPDGPPQPASSPDARTVAPTPSPTPRERTVGAPVRTSAPRSGESGVGLSAELQLTFVEPMDIGLTSRAIEVTCSCTAGAVPGALLWNQDATLATFHPEIQLPHGAVVSWQVSQSARTARGEGFQQGSQGKFRMLRLETRALTPVFGLAGIVDSEGWVSATGPMVIGDEGLGRFVDVFLTFDLSQLDPATTRIISAELSVRQADVGGSPYELGAFLATSVDFGAELDVNDLRGAHVTGEAVVLSDNDAIGVKTVSATAKVSDDFQHREARDYRSQYQLGFERQALGGAGSNLVWLTPPDQGSQGPTLTVTTEVP
jgi:hypothetical protein